MNTKEYLTKFRELREKNEGQEERYPISSREGYKVMMDWLSLFDEFSNEEEPDIGLVAKKMKNPLLSHYRYFCEHYDFGKEVIELNYEFSQYLESLGYDL